MKRKGTEITYRPGEHGEKFDAIARLSSVLAHKINNPLTFMTNYLFLLRQTSLCDEGALGMVGSIEGGVHRTRDILRELLDASRPCTGPREDIDLKRIINDSLKCMPEAMADIKVRVDVPAALTVRTEGEGLMDAITILGANAIESGSGKVVFSASSEGGRTVIRVQDSGGGIPPEAIALIFDPLYTTREGHMGLGLYRAYHIAASLGGSVWCKSWVSCSEFTLELPE